MKVSAHRIFPLKVMLDTNGYDCILDSGLVPLVLKLIGTGKIKILRTHIQQDEIEAIPDERKEKREKLLAIPSELIATESALYGISRYDLAKLGRVKSFKVIQRGNPAHNKDALIAETAAKHAQIFLTNEKGLRSKINELSHEIEVYNCEGFKAFLIELDRDC